MAAKKKTTTRKTDAAGNGSKSPRGRPKHPKVVREDNVAFDNANNPTVDPSITVRVDGSDELRTIHLSQLTPRVKICAALNGIWHAVRGTANPMALLDDMLAGNYPMPRRSGGSTRRVPAVVSALSRETGLTEAQCAERWATLTAEDQKRVKSDPRIRQHLIAIRAERSGKSDSGLAELFAEPATPPEAPAPERAASTPPPPADFQPVAGMGQLPPMAQ